MKFNIEKKELSAITTLISRAASSAQGKNTISVLSGILIETKDNILTMSATNTEIGMIVKSNEATIEEEGKILVNASLFSSFIKTLPDMIITIEMDEKRNKLKITYGKSFGYLNLYSEESYPSFPNVPEVPLFTIPKYKLREGLNKTVFATAIQHFRPIFTGVLFNLKENGILDIVASDTHRMACFTGNDEINAPKNEITNFIIPKKAVDELLRVIDFGEEEVSVFINQNNVIFKYENFLMFSRTIDGEYPNYANVIPAKFMTELLIDTSIIYTALERSRTMPADEKFKIPNITLNLSENGITVETFSEASGEIKEYLENIEVSGDINYKICFNTDYFLQITKCLANESEKIKICLSGSLGSAKILNPDKENYVYILVPLRSGY